MTPRSALPLARRLLALFATALLLAPPAGAEEPLRIAVVGGIQMCGVWDRLVPRIEKATGVKIATASSAPKTQIIPDFRSGAADLLLIHGGSETFGLQAEGIGGQQRVWAFNEHAIVGPDSDPAKVRAATDAHEAFEQIARSKSPFLAFRDPGSHEIVQNIWKRSRLQASPDWVLLDETARPQEILELAAQRRAYVVVGAIPAAFEKLRGEGLKVLLKGDPAMRRAYVVMEPGARHPATAAARQQAARVADYLTSPAGQADLAAADREAGGPWLFPLPAADAPSARAGGRPGSGQGGGQGNGQGGGHGPGGGNGQGRQSQQNQPHEPTSEHS
jgi:tungstate transport system substrate-binding protein